MPDSSTDINVEWAFRVGNTPSLLDDGVDGEPRDLGLASQRHVRVKVFRLLGMNRHPLKGMASCLPAFLKSCVLLVAWILVAIVLEMHRSGAVLLTDEAVTEAVSLRI